MGSASQEEVGERRPCLSISLEYHSWSRKCFARTATFATRAQLAPGWPVIGLRGTTTSTALPVECSMRRLWPTEMNNKCYYSSSRLAPREKLCFTVITQRWESVRFCSKSIQNAREFAIQSPCRTRLMFGTPKLKLNAPSLNRTAAVVKK